MREQLLRTPVAARLGWEHRQRALSLGHLLASVKLLAEDTIAWEQRYLARVAGVELDTIRGFYQDLSNKVRLAPGNEAYLCLGRGAGWHKSTVGLFLQEAEDFDFPAFRRQGGTSERRGPGFDRTDFEFPKTRKFLMEGADQPGAPLGWVHLVLPELAVPAEVLVAPSPQGPGVGPPAAKPPSPAPRAGEQARPRQPKADVDALRERFAKPTGQGQRDQKTTKAAEKAKREQEKIARRYRGEEK